MYRVGNWVRYAAIMSAIAGYALFGFAVVNAYHAVVWAFAA